MTPVELQYAEALAADLRKMGQVVSAKLVERLLAERALLLESCQLVIEICEDTFIDPQEMAPDWVLTFNTLTAAVAFAAPATVSKPDVSC